MALLPDTLLELAASGASLRVDASRVTIGQLNQLAAAVGDAGGTLTITNADKLTPQIAKGLAAIGGIHVCFDAS